MTIETVILIKRLINQGRFKVDTITGEVVNTANNKSSFDLEPSEDGHLTFVMNVNGKRKRIKACHVVAVVGGLNTTGKIVYHVNGNKCDNRLYNLDIMEHADFMRHLNDTKPTADHCDFERIKVKRKGLTKKQVAEIKQKMADGAKNKDLAIEYNMSSSQISAIRTGRSWAHIPMPTPKYQATPRPKWHVEWNGGMVR